MCWRSSFYSIAYVCTIYKQKKITTISNNKYEQQKDTTTQGCNNTTRSNTMSQVRRQNSYTLREREDFLMVMNVADLSTV